MPRIPSRSLSAVRIAFVAFWCLFVSASLLFKASARFLGWPRWNRFSLEENRNLASFPHLRSLPARKWGPAIDAWYSDQFAWRAPIIQFYRYVHLSILHSSIKAQEVPGRGDWVFRRSGSWAEMEDYLGAFELSPDEIARWLELFEGRVQWAEAHGARYLEVITPVKAQIHPERMLPIFAIHHRPGVASQIRAALASSPARDNVLFVSDAIADITRRNRQVYFYATDHHVNGYGCYVIFREMMRAAERWFGPMDFPPYSDVPSDDVLSGRAWGCFRSGNPGYERLSVRIPGAVEVRSPYYSIYGPGAPKSARYLTLDFTLASGTNRLAIAHDSFLRFPLRSWYHPEEEPVLVPIGSAFCRVLDLMFTRLNTARLDCIVSAEQPNLIIEQFPEIKLTQEVYGYDDTMRDAAAFGRGSPVDPSDLASLPPGTTLSARAVLRDVTDPSGEWHDMRASKNPPAISIDLLDARGSVLASRTVYPGPIRAAFFSPIPLPAPDCLPLRLAVRDGSASAPPDLSLSAHLP